MGRISAKKHLALCITCVYFLLQLMIPAHAHAGSIGTTVTAALTELFHGPVSVGSAELRGLGRIVITDLRVYDPQDETVAVLSVDRVSFRYSLLGLMLNLNNVGRAITGVELVHPVATITRERRGWNVSRLVRLGGLDGSEAPQEMSLTVTDGKFILRGLDIGMAELPFRLDGTVGIKPEGMLLDQVRLGLFEAQLAGSGTIESGRADLTLQSNSVDFARFTKHFPQLSGLEVSGTADISASVTGPVFDPLVEGEVCLTSGGLRTPLLEEADYRIDLMRAQFRYQTGQVFLAETIIEKDNSAIELAGSVAIDGSLDLETKMTSFDIAASIPRAARYGVGGMVDFVGTIKGTLREPVLRGQITRTESGTFLGRAVDDIEGAVTLSPRQVSVKQLLLRQGEARYELTGGVGFRGLQLLDLTVKFIEGQAHEFLAALGIAGELQATMDGSIHFIGPLWRLDADGQIRLSNGRFMGQQFDETEGAFTLSGNMVSITEGRASYNGASVFFSGSGLKGKPLRLDVVADGWLLEDISLLENRGAFQQSPRRGERIAFTGKAYVEGTLAEPEARLEAVVFDGGAGYYNVNLQIAEQAVRLINMGSTR